MKKISVQLAKSLREIKEAESIEGFNIDSSYSGRGMYGKTCLGLSFDYLGDAFQLILMMESPELAKEVTEFFSDCSRDSMGQGVIFYGWDYTWPEEVSLN